MWMVTVLYSQQDLQQGINVGERCSWWRRMKVRPLLQLKVVLCLLMVDAHMQHCPSLEKASIHYCVHTFCLRECCSVFVDRLVNKSRLYNSESSRCAMGDQWPISHEYGCVRVVWCMSSCSSNCWFSSEHS